MRLQQKPTDLPYAQPHNMGGTYGTQMVNWDTGATFGTGAGGSIDAVETDPDGGTMSALLPYNASFASVDADLTTPIPYVNLKNIVFWAWLPEGQSHQTINIFISDSTGFVNYYIAPVIIDKTGWNLYAFVTNQEGGSHQMPKVTGTIAWASATVSRIRVRDLSDLANTSYSGAVPGDQVRIGQIYMNYRTRPKFMIQCDDGLDSLVSVPFGTDTIKSILDEYNFKAGVAVITGSVGTGSPYETLANLQLLYSLGWDMMNHTKDVPSGNLTDLADAQAIADDLDNAEDDLAGWGFTRTPGVHDLPQGQFDRKVWDAFDLTTHTFTSIRGTFNDIFGFPGIAYGGSTDHVTGNNTIFKSAIYSFPGSVQWDTNSDVTADLEKHVDMCISRGLTGISYGHGLNAQIILNLRALCDRLKLREEQGLIDVITFYEWNRDVAS